MLMKRYQEIVMKWARLLSNRYLIGASRRGAGVLHRLFCRTGPGNEYKPLKDNVATEARSIEIRSFDFVSHIISTIMYCLSNEFFLVNKSYYSFYNLWTT